MPDRALATLPPNPAPLGLGDLAEAVSRAIVEGMGIPAHLLSLDRRPTTWDLHTCAGCGLQAHTPFGQAPAAWSAPDGPNGPLFCPDCDPGPAPGAICPSQIVPEVRATWEGARA